MNPNPLPHIASNSADANPIQRKAMRERAVGIAHADGRSAQDVSKSDWEQARLELTASRDRALKDTPLTGSSESVHQTSLLGATGDKSPVISEDNEDEEGPNIAERFAEECRATARLEQARQTGPKRNL
jgi:hypothetical protein